jgi:hypothetical protein
MSTGRRILVFLLAVALAMLPAAGHAGYVAAAAAPAMTDTSAMHHGSEMHHHDVAMDDMADCCPHKHDGSHKAVDDCASMAGCTLCVGFLAPTDSALISPVLPTGAAVSFASTPLHSQIGSPPFRPPRG